MSIEFMEEGCIDHGAAALIAQFRGIEFEAPALSRTKIRVVGAGGVGNNALNTMIESGSMMA